MLPIPPSTMALLLALTAACATAAESRTIPGWGTWTKRDAPVFAGQFGIAGDPCVVRRGGELRMLFGGFDPWKEPQGPATCAARSPDGLSWTELDSGDAVHGRVILPGTGPWEDTHETPFWLPRPDGGWSMWFIGYLAAEHAAGWGLFATSIGYATSTDDGRSFTAPTSGPVIAPGAGGFDARALTSPSVVRTDAGYRMVYAGWWNPTPATVGITLLMATSTDGTTWTKRPAPVLAGIDLPGFMADHVAEPELVHAPDGTWYLFFTASRDGQPHTIGMARAPTADGPWSICPEPLIVPTPAGFDARDAVAPSVLIEDGKVRLWYAGFSADGQRIAIGYAESPWPFAMEVAGELETDAGRCGVGGLGTILGVSCLLLMRSGNRIRSRRCRLRKA